MDDQLLMIPSAKAFRYYPPILLISRVPSKEQARIRPSALVIGKSPKNRGISMRLLFSFQNAISPHSIQTNKAAFHTANTYFNQNQAPNYVQSRMITKFKRRWKE
jgi:hypothetical protein